MTIATLSASPARRPSPALRLWRLARGFLAASGPGYFVAVGYMDPGNWATDIAGGARFGYALLSVVLLANLMAMVLQALSARLAIATGRDLAQASHDFLPRRVGLALWAMAEIAIVATGVAEVVGSAIALNLLFGLPIALGAALTVADVALIVVLQRRGFGGLQALVIALIGVVAAGFGYQLLLAAPPWAAVAAGFVPSTAILRDPAMLYLAVGIIGATVMPHNLYLHGAIVRDRGISGDKRAAMAFATADSTVALTVALAINAAILIVAAAAFHAGGRTEVAEIADAHALIAPALGAPLAAVAFAVALLAAGQNSSLTATLAGDVVMAGFVGRRVAPWKRRLATRLLAAVPVILATSLLGDASTGSLLVLSQVVLSLQLPFAVIPLVLFTGSRARMGAFASPAWLQVTAWTIAAAIVGLNIAMLAGPAAG
jgi:manganese transport protein